MVTQAGEGLVLGSQPRHIPVWRGPSFSQFLGLPNLPEICLPSANTCHWRHCRASACIAFRTRYCFAMSVRRSVRPSV